MQENSSAALRTTCSLVVETPAGPVNHVIREGEYSIGGSVRNDVVVEHPTVSRRHAVIRCQDGHLSIEDMESRNGTYVNGVHVKRAALQCGDQVHLGLGVLRIEASQQEAEAVEISPELDLAPVEMDEPAEDVEVASAPIFPMVWPTPTLPPAEVAAGWLDLVHGLVELALGPEPIERRRALKAAVVALEASGGSLVEWHGSEQPHAVCSYGSVEGAVGAGALSSWFATSSPEAGGPTFLILPPVGASPPLAGAWAAVRDGVDVALVVSGDFPGRQQSGPLLATCARLLGVMSSDGD